MIRLVHFRIGYFVEELYFYAVAMKCFVAAFIPGKSNCPPHVSYILTVRNDLSLLSSDSRRYIPRFHTLLPLLPPRRLGRSDLFAHIHFRVAAILGR